MEPLQFLGGKYQEPEQIVPGEVQTFRAREASTGQTVFVHRVSTAMGDAQQAALLRLVLQGLFRSPSARSHVLDFGEEPGYCYVVTESSPQCLLLREWLQFELESSPTGRDDQASKSVSGTEPKPQADGAPAVNRPDRRTTVDAKAGPVAFVIREQPAKPSPVPPPSPVQATPASPAQAPPASSAPSRVEFVKKDPVPAGPPKPQPPAWDLDPEPTKFETRVEPAPPKVEPAKPRLEPAASKVETGAPKVDPIPAGPSQGEPGEFTRFFKGGLPPSAPSRTDAFRSQDRPSHGFGPVQRPGNPPAMPPKSEPGEFTRVFMKTGGDSATPTAPPPTSPKPSVNPPSNRTAFPDESEFGSNNPFNTPRVDRVPDLSHRADDLPSMFQLKAEAPTPMPSASQEPGEYTRMFGKGSIPPPPQAPSAVGPAPSFRIDDPVGSTNFGMPAPSAPAAPPQPSGPSEFTRMMMGTRPPESGGGQGAPAASAPPAGGGSAGFAPPALGKPPAMPGQMPGMGGAPAAPGSGGQMHNAGPSGHGGQQMGGGMGPVHVTPINPIHGMAGAGMGQGVSTNLGPLGSAGASAGNPMMGQAGQMGIMTPMGRAQMGGGSMQPMGHQGESVGHTGPAAGGYGMPGKMPGKMPGALPKAPTTGLGSKGKLLILFAVLGVLALAMVLFVIFSSHK